MKKMKKFLSLALTGALSAAMLAGCGGSSGTEGTSTSSNGGNSSSDEVVTLRMWGGLPPENGPQKMCENFNELYKDKGIQVEYERFVNDQTGNLKLETNLISGDSIDIFITYDANVLSKRATSNMALDLTDLIARDSFDVEGIFGSIGNAYNVDGKTYALPTVQDRNRLVINKTMFDEAGIEIPTEWTFEEFREIAKKLTHGEGQDKVYGMFWNTQQSISQAIGQLTCQTLGGDWSYKEGNDKESNFTDPSVIAAVELLDNMMNVDGSSPTHVDSTTQKLSQESMFLAGKSAMTFGSWIFRNVKNTEEYPHDFVTAFAPHPVYKEGERNYTQGNGGDFISINSKSEHIDEAWEFVKWYATEGMLPLVEGGRIPTATTYDTEEVSAAFMKGGEELFDAESTNRAFFEQSDLPFSTPKLNNKIGEITKVLQEEVEQAITHKISASEAMENAKTRSDEILK